MQKFASLDVVKHTRDDKFLISIVIFVSTLLCLTGLTVGCGSLSSSQNAASSSANGSSPRLTLSPDTATVASLDKLQFVARVSGSSNTTVTWSTTAGTISSDGIFTAPNVASNTPVTVTVTSPSQPVPTRVGDGNHSTDNPTTGKNTPTSGGSSSASSTVIVTAPTTFAVSTSALPAAETTVSYSATLAATGGVKPYRWNLANGALPSGIQLEGSSGVISGTTAFSGSYPITAKVTDAAGHTATAGLSLTVSPVSASGFDGPAELPRILIQTGMSNTPAAGNIVTVNAGGNFQSALNSAQCGDTIHLQAGATFTGVFTFPAKNCDENHWIVVRTSADDSLLPPEGSRLTPCYAGVSSLPGRPSFHCASVTNVLAKLMLTATNNGPVTFAAGANYYRLVGLEITRPAGTGAVNALAFIASGGTANNLIFDRVWLHGTAQDETTRGVALAGGTYISIVDSFFTDFHCISVSGSCTDAQAISGGIGTSPGGPYKIAGNFLEASGENIIFGGDSGTTTPADIQISQNHMFKPLTWMKGQPGYVGGANGNPFSVKNLLELKNAQRVLIEGNIMEDTWGGFSQVGFGIVLTPKNPGGTSPCPVCQVSDVTIRYNTISHVGSGLQIANALSDNGTGALDGQRYSIHDITVDDIDGVKYNGPSEFAQVSVSAGAPLLQNVTINHITAFPANDLFIIGDMVATSGPMKNFVFTNSISYAGIYPIWSTGGTGNCAIADLPLTTVTGCFSNYSFINNAIMAPGSNYPVSAWPKNNFFPASADVVQFVNYKGGNGGNYQLQSSSPYRGKGTDGKDLGADLNAILAATAGVQ
ncbi:MAG: hypothetical protein JWQ87_4559 [Candidatus Sulfotelmatobacter sp.]|nr:hypothetical protein [Candidatus Sulfotelmatobacter sp.]